MAKMNVKGVGGPMENPQSESSMPSRSRGGIKDKLNAAMERANAGRQAKLKAKSEKAFEQGNVIKGIKLKAKEVKVGARGEKREAIGLSKKAQKVGKMLGEAYPQFMMKSTSTPMNSFENTPRIGNRLTKRNG